MDEQTLDERRLSTALEEIADEHEVSVVPLERIKGAPPVGRSWRAPLLAAAAVVLVAGVAVPLGVGWWQDQNQVTSMPGKVTLPDASVPDGSEVAPGARLAGIGEVAIEVPAGWGTNDTRCGTPQSNTLVIDTRSTCLAYFPRQAGVETIELHPMQAVVDLVGEPVRSERFLGVEATRWQTTCHDNDSDVRTFDVEPARVCVAQVWLHGDDDVQFRATAATAERAEELLSTIRRTPGHVGLTGPADFQRYDLRMSEKTTAQVVKAYVKHLRTQGLDPVLRTESDPDDPRTTIQVSPAPGTVLERGARVSVVLGSAGS